MIETKKEFQEIYISNLKIILLYRSRFWFVSIFTGDSDSKSSKIFLTFLSTALHNFNINLEETNQFIKSIITKIYGGLVSAVNSSLATASTISPNQRLSASKLNVLVSEVLAAESGRSEVLQLRVIEKFFIRSLSNHFFKVTEYLIQNEEMNLNNIKFKNLYIIDLQSEDIIFDLNRTRGVVKSKKFYKNEKIWQEVLYHSQGMKSAYIQENGVNYDATDSIFRVSLG